MEKWKKETKSIDQGSKKTLCTILKQFTKQEAKLLNSKATKGTGLNILTPKQMLQRLPIALPRQITKKVYHKIIKSIQ